MCGLIALICQYRSEPRKASSARSQRPPFRKPYLRFLWLSLSPSLCVVLSLFFGLSLSLSGALSLSLLFAVSFALSLSFFLAHSMSLSLSLSCSLFLAHSMSLSPFLSLPTSVHPAHMETTIYTHMHAFAERHTH